jgi:hypothetical protein
MRPTFSKILLAACVIAGLASLSLAMARNFNPWIVVSSPLQEPMTANSVAGYSAVAGDLLVQKENVSPFGQALLFLEGKVGHIDFYYKRAVTPLLYSIVAPFFGLLVGAALTNSVCFVVSVWSVYATLSHLRPHGSAKWLGAAFAATGLGWFVHLADFSAHPTAFASYFLGTALLVRYLRHPGVLQWRSHLAIGCLLALANLTYNSGLYLTAAYGLVSIMRREKLLWVGGAMVIALIPPLIWPWVLLLPKWRSYWRSGGTSITDFLAANSLHNDEGRYLAGAISTWVLLFHTPGQLVRSVLRYFYEFLFLDSPVVVGVAAISGTLTLWRGWIERRVSLLLLLLIALPIVGGIVWAPSALARGYIAFGSAAGIAIFAALGLGRFVDRLQGRGMVGLGATVAAVIVCAHAAWNLLPFLGYSYVAESYFIAQSSLGNLMNRPLVLDMATGQEGQSAVFAAAAALTDPAWQPDTVGMRGLGVALAFRLLPFVLACGAIAWGAGRYRRPLLILALTVFLLPPAYAALRGKSAALPTTWLEGAVPLTGEATLTIDTVSALRDQLGRGADDKVEILIPRSENAVFVLTGEKSPCSQPSANCTTDGAALAAYLDAVGGRVTVRFVPTAANGRLLGWQVASVVGRNWAPSGGAAGAVLPAFEIRLWQNEALRMVAY